MTDTAIDVVHGAEAGRWGGWSWREPRYGDFFRTCSYCGSIHPEDLAAEAASDACTVCGARGWLNHFQDNEHSGSPLPCDCETPCHPFAPAGWYASWADQKYGWPHKFYVEGLRSRDPGLLRYMGSSSPRPEPPDGSGWVAAKDLTRAQKKVLKAESVQHARDGGWYLFGTKPTAFAKFYTRHLADPAVSDEVKDKIAQASGLRFHFGDDGRVSWHGATVPCAEVPGHP